MRFHYNFLDSRISIKATRYIRSQIFLFFQKSMGKCTLGCYNFGKLMSIFKVYLQRS
jgi:hypothetical protein